MWRVVVKAGISITLICVLLWHQDLAALCRQMSGIDRGLLLGAIGLSAALTVAVSLRWSAILDAVGSPQGLRTTLPLVFIGLFFSQLLPSGIGGDVARMWLARSKGLRLSVAVSSVMVDRLSGLLALLILVTAAVPELFHAAVDTSVTGATMLLLLAGYSGFAITLVLDRAPKALDRFKVVRGLRQLAVDARATLLRPTAALRVLGYSFVNQAGTVLVIFVLAKGLALPLSVTACLFVVPLANLFQTLPISIAGWGVRESFFVMGFGLFGVLPRDALALSVVFGFIGVMISLPGSVLWLIQKRAGHEPSLRPLREAVAPLPASAE